MKPTLLSVKEVAQELGVSPQFIRRAYGRGDIPAYRISTMLRFDLERVQRMVLANGGVEDRTTRRSAIAGGGRRRAQPKRPRSVKRGLV
jgi:excisionase family DNA binding protein